MRRTRFWIVGGRFIGIDLISLAERHLVLAKESAHQTTQAAQAIRATAAGRVP